MKLVNNVVDRVQNLWSKLGDMTYNPSIHANVSHRKQKKYLDSLADDIVDYVLHLEKIDEIIKTKKDQIQKQENNILELMQKKDNDAEINDIIEVKLLLQKDVVWLEEEMVKNNESLANLRKQFEKFKRCLVINELKVARINIMQTLGKTQVKDSNFPISDNSNNLDDIINEMSQKSRKRDMKNKLMDIESEETVIVTDNEIKAEYDRMKNSVSS